MKSGIVKNYIADRGFGFIKTEDGKDVFFHIKNGKGVKAGKNEPELPRFLKTVLEPKTGDRLMFELAQGQKGSIADPWCFADDWERVQQEIASQKVSEAVPLAESDKKPYDIGQAHENKNDDRPRHSGNKKRHGDFGEDHRPTPYNRTRTRKE